MGAEAVKDSAEEGRSQTVAAIVVLFHPEPVRLRALYEAIQGQVGRVWFVDNTPAVPAERAYLPGSDGPAWEVAYLPLGDNLGIATAQNIGIAAARKAGFDHVLLLDQDSLLPGDTVEKLMAAETLLLERFGPQVAAVGPVFVDEKTGHPGKVHQHRWFRMHKHFVDLAAADPIETDWLIASGSLLRLAALDVVGPMREDLFIDAVDMEWGMRARSLGLRSYVVPTAPIAHSIGDAFAKVLGSTIILHSELRNYYIARNWLFLVRVPTMGLRWRSGTVPHTAKFLLAHVWLAPDRLRQARLFARAVADAVRGRMGRYDRTR